ncbi:MAG TPA: hypothetical protein VNC79_05255, partial [Mycobacteriales bacterium]|nr:hypothetical protein [Mycobacteriales bacterium]
MPDLTEASGPGSDAAAPLPAGSPPPLPRRVPQVPPPPFGVAVSPGGESLFQPPKRRPPVERLRENEQAAARWPTPSSAPASPAPPAAVDEPGR